MGPGEIIIAFECEGKPVPQGSLQSGGKGQLFYSNAARLKPYRNNVKNAAITAKRAAGMGALDKPVFVNVGFYFERPASHFTSKGELKKGAPTHPTSRYYGDTDKLIRSVGDALTEAQVYVDDSYVVSWFAEKAYVMAGEKAYTTVSVGVYG